jgi:hypothetical protein
MNLGHYHAMFRRHSYLDGSSEAKTFKAKQARLLQAQLALLNYALRFNHSYERWKTIVNVMIPKKSGQLQNPSASCYSHLRSRLQFAPRSQMA